MKNIEELNILKGEGETMNKMLTELSEDELNQISGGNLTAEAQQWLDRNLLEILNRANQNKAKFRGLASDLSTLVNTNSATIVSLEYLKKEIGKWVDLNGLE